MGSECSTADFEKLKLDISLFEYAYINPLNDLNKVKDARDKRRHSEEALRTSWRGRSMMQWPLARRWAPKKEENTTCLINSALPWQTVLGAISENESVAIFFNLSLKEVRNG